MPTIDNEQFDLLLSEGKYEEAKQLLKDFIDSEWTKDDEGEYYVGLIEEYLKMSNAINQAYLDEVAEIEAQLKQLDEIQSDADKNVALNNIRDDIAKM